MEREREPETHISLRPARPLRPQPVGAPRFSDAGSRDHSKSHPCGNQIQTLSGRPGRGGGGVGPAPEVRVSQCSESDRIPSFTCGHAQESEIRGQDQNSPPPSPLPNPPIVLECSSLQQNFPRPFHTFGLFLTGDPSQCDGQPLSCNQAGYSLLECVPCKRRLASSSPARSSADGEGLCGRGLTDSLVNPTSLRVVGVSLSARAAAGMDSDSGSSPSEMCSAWRLSSDNGLPSRAPVT